MFSDQERPFVSKTLLEIEEDDILHQFDNMTARVSGSERRRAAVFYVDTGDSVMDYVRWWIYTWTEIGLDSVDEAFDIVMMTHPAMVSKLPSHCKLITSDWKLNFSLPGLNN